MFQLHNQLTSNTSMHWIYETVRNAESQRNRGILFQRVVNENLREFIMGKSFLYRLMCDTVMSVEQMCEVTQHIATAKYLAGLKRKIGVVNQKNRYKFKY